MQYRHFDLNKAVIGRFFALNTMHFSVRCAYHHQTLRKVNYS